MPGGDAARLFDFIPVRDEGERLLILSWLCSALSSIITPILLQLGQPGAAKTTRTRMMRSLLDPSITGPLGEVVGKNLAQIMLHHGVPCFDNLGPLSRPVADIFCRAVTGDGIERRRLYTDLDEVILVFRRPIILNGIELPSTRADFLDRSLILHADRIELFRSQSEINDEFEQARPQLFGALLDLLVRVLRILPDTAPAREFRMADFARVGRAVARALGQNETQFDEAYRATLRDELRETADDDPLSRASILLADKYNRQGSAFIGTGSQLEAQLIEIAKAAKISTSGQDWPRSPRWVAARMLELAPALKTKGVHVERLRRTNNSRLIKVGRIDGARRETSAVGPARL